jgi:serpin B
LSPFSISTALAMLDAGAAGTTDAELRAASGFAAVPGDRLHAAYGALLASLDIGRGYGAYTLATADRLFGQQGFPFLPAFLAITKDDYGAELMPVDFAGDTEAARATINQWVASRTDGGIPELFSQGILDATTRLVLANAILFKGTWQTRFDPAVTSDGPFHLADGTTVTAPMMTKEDAVAQATIPGGALAVLPFKGQDLAMIVLLPDAADGLPALEAQLSGAALAQWIGAASAIDTSLTLPRFGVASTFDLGAVLQGLGVTSAFDPAAADLSAMDGQRDLSVQAVVHRAVVTVDEVGATAAAATGISVGKHAAARSLTIDRPFLFLIHDEVTGSVLFLGRLADPTK